jgi:predicted PurR-regulated permease PerM
MKAPAYIKIPLILLGFTLFFFILYIWSNILVPIFLSLLFSILMLPFSNWAEKKGVSRKSGAVLSIIIVFLLFSAFIFFLSYQIQQIAAQGEHIQEELNEVLEEVQTFIQENLGVERKQIQEQLDQIQQEASGFFQQIFGAGTALITAMILIPFSMFFMMIYRDHYKKFLFQLFSKNEHDRIKHILNKEKNITVKYITGIFQVVLILAICNTIALTIIGVEHAIFFGVIAGFLNIIPVVGSFLGSLLPIFYTLVMEDSIWIPVIIAIYFSFIQTMESYVLTPNIVGDKIKINPYAIILAIFIGGQVWGPAGMVLFIPMLAIVKVLCQLIEPLKPYGFLLSDPESDKSSKIKKLINKIQDKIKK